MEPIDWPTLFAWMDGRAEIPNRSFLLTFDDGLADHAETVLPILEDRGLRGVFFVPGAVLTTHRMLPAHSIHLLLSVLGESALENELRSYFSNRGAMQWCHWLDQRPPEEDAAAETMYLYESPSLARLKYLLTMKLPLDLRAAAVEELFEQHVGSSPRWSRHWYLGWDDLVKIQSLGHTIGGHGHAHEPYDRLPSDEIRQDVLQIAAVLREGLGPDVRPFSYPYGSYNNQAVAACREAGFVHGFTTHRAWVEPHADPLRLPRFDTIDVNAVLREKMACQQV
jgi:peptidoglycan/xylan/chitin deacetylase (PgdA/CDA1 family)